MLIGRLEVLHFNHRANKGPANCSNQIIINILYLHLLAFAESICQFTKATPALKGRLFAKHFEDCSLPSSAKAARVDSSREVPEQA